MNREIKFRAWDGESKKMIYVRDNRYIQLFEDGSGRIVFAAQDEFEMVKLNKNTPLMQFTGLKDKNGKEIYEGDILSDVKIGFSGLMEWDLEHGEWTKFSPLNRFEIIGNIYETPELLTPTQ